MVIGKLLKPLGTPCVPQRMSQRTSLAGLAQ
jgi:hypothetical protein